MNMLAPTMKAKIRVLSVDDHVFLADGLRARLSLEPDMELVGHVSSAAGLVDQVIATDSQVVLLDIEMPSGPDPFEAVVELRRKRPNVRTIVLSAFIRDRYIDATVKAGAWGYLSKGDDPASIIGAIRDVVAGKFTFGPAVLERCRQLGQGGQRTEAIDQLEPGPTDSGAAEPKPVAANGLSRLSSLTARELQILRMIGKGMSRTDIAKVIYRSPKTVDAHRAALMEKLGIHDRVELARYAIREGLVEI